jgi:hypothetical protein
LKKGFWNPKNFERPKALLSATDFPSSKKALLLQNRRKSAFLCGTEAILPKTKFWAHQGS